MSAVTKKSDTHEERYVHVEIKNHPRIKMATIFARREGDGWGYAVAFCHVQDQFDRRVGRLIARRKYFREGGKYLGTAFTYTRAVEAALTCLPKAV